MITVKRALLSCYDKSGLDEFAKTLAALGVELIASGGTAEFLTKQGLRVTTVEAFAGISEQLDGRVKTLHPKIHAGLLARRDDPKHVNAVGSSGLIDLVAVNLYPFERTARQSGATHRDVIEQIDVGGVALLRAAAKNFAYVAAVSRSAQYAMIGEALQQGKGQLPESMSRQLAGEAFRLTSAYDTWIAGYLDGQDATQEFPDVVTINLRKRQPLRYGENPHQRAAWYAPQTSSAWGLETFRQLQGKELSYNNLLDIDAAFRCLLDFDEPTCAIIKHHSQCGLASATAVEQAYERALTCDAPSAFGGIVGVNRPIEAPLAKRLTSTFLEVIVAPSVESEAAAVFSKKPNLRVVTLDWPAGSAAPREARGFSVEWRHLLGGWLLQEPDTLTFTEASLRVVTSRAPTNEERQGLLFAWTSAKHATSNAIVLARGTETVGIGQGQPSRVGSVRLAIEQAGSRSRHAVAASDGFFPFPDSIELLAKAGVTAVIQPGGSIKDPEVIAAADAAGMAMLFTGVRHFRH